VWYVGTEQEVGKRGREGRREEERERMKMNDSSKEWIQKLSTPTLNMDTLRSTLT
jgi:hypothetical protein